MQNIIKWSDDFDVGIEKMNDEHKIIIDLIGKVYRQNQQGENIDKIMQTIEELAEFTVKHFEEEEAYMESINYPQLDVHKKIHEKLLKDLSEHVENSKKTGNVEQSFFVFLNMWLSAHIKGIDMKYSPKNQANDLKKAS